MVNSVFSEKKKTKKSANPRQDKIAVFSRRKGAGILCVFQTRQQRKTAILLVSGGVDYYYNCFINANRGSGIKKGKNYCRSPFVYELRKNPLKESNCKIVLG